MGFDREEFKELDKDFEDSIFQKFNYRLRVTRDN